MHTTTPVTPRWAATVALLRDGPAGVEVFALERVSSMAFAPGMTVFPGGGVDACDFTCSGLWVGPSSFPAFGVPDDVARASIVAAHRELAEETSVTLAEEGGDARWPTVVRADLLTALGRWITPRAQPRRYDTMFFAARCPDSAVPQLGPTMTEAVQGYWASPAALLDRLAGASNDPSTLRMLPPTIVTLRDLSRFSCVASALAAPRRIGPIEPADDADLSGDPLG